MWGTQLAAMLIVFKTKQILCKCVQVCKTYENSFWIRLKIHCFLFFSGQLDKLFAICKTDMIIYHWLSLAVAWGLNLQIKNRLQINPFLKISKCYLPLEIRCNQNKFSSVLEFVYITGFSNCWLLQKNKTNYLVAEYCWSKQEFIPGGLEQLN